MAQETDIVLNGAGYMIAGSKYVRGQDGAPEGRTGRVTLRDFFGGMRRHIQLERDKAFTGVGVGPALNGQGVQPLGKLEVAYHSVGYAAGILPSRIRRIPHAIVRDQLYYALGFNVYRFENGGTVTARMGDPADPHITDMCIYAEDGILLTYGAAKDLTFYSTTQNASQALKAGERGYSVAAYAGYAVWNDARPTARPSYLIQVHGTGTDIRILDYPVIGFANVGAEVYAISKGAIYAYRGRVHEVSKPNPAYVNPTATPTEKPTITGHEWSGEWEPFFQQGIAGGDDYRLMEGYGGDLFAWIDGRVMRYKPSGERAGWEDTGLSGRECLGGCVAGGYLLVSIISHENQNELWIWDGSGWWRIASKAAAASGNWVWPLPVSGTTYGTAFDWDAVLFREGQTTIDRLRLDGGGANYAYPATAEFITSMIDAAERDKEKAWRRIGVVFATPERTGNTASADLVQVAIDYSTDGGASWTTNPLIPRTGNTAINQLITAEYDITASSRFLQLRVRWNSITDWAPVLVGAWAEFEILDSPARRRRWNLDIQASDQTINRDGSKLTRTGRQLIAELWAAWQSGATVPLRDIDYDADPTQRTVRIVGISEKANRPSNHGSWGESVVTLVLVEV